jgi:protein O-mannosyl-transferase
MFRHPAFLLSQMKTELKASTCTLILVFLVLGLYYSAIFAPINSVDDPGMYQYLLNTDHFTLGTIFLPGGSGNYYRPILLASFVIDKYLWGLQESFMHLENVLLHLANTLLLFAVARRALALRAVQSPVPAFLAALFFAIHPINTEPVNWISGRTDLLAASFLLLAALQLLRRPLSPLRSISAASFLLLACLCKETSIFFLPAALLAPFFVEPAEGEPVRPLQLLRSHAAHLSLFFCTGAGYLIFRSVAFSQGDQGVARVLSHVAGEQSAGVLTSLRLVLKALGFYGKKILAPFPLNFAINHVSDGYMVLALLICVALVWLLVRRTLPGFFFICAASVTGSALMIPLLRVTWTPLAERYLYIPGAFFVIGVMLSLQNRTALQRHRLVTQAALAALALIALWGTWQRNLIWLDNLALFQDTVAKSPGFMPARNQLANALFGKGRVQEAAVIYKAFQAEPDLTNPQYGLVNKAFALNGEGKFDEARAILTKALATPGKLELLILNQMLEINKCQAMQNPALSASLLPDNVRLLTRVIELTGDTFYQYRLGIVEMQNGSRDKALQAFDAAVRRAPANAYYRDSAVKLIAKLAKTTAHAAKEVNEKND